MKDGDDAEQAHGVNGRSITVLHETTRPNGMSGATANSDEEEKFKEKMGLNTKEDSVSSTPQSSNNGNHEDENDDEDHGTGAKPDLERRSTTNSQAR